MAKFTKQYFTQNSTWVCPPGITDIMITGYGGGGAGGGGGASASGTNGGGGGGGSLQGTMFVSVVPGSIYTVVIGAGGLGATGQVAGGAGSSTYFSNSNGVILAKFSGASGGVAGTTTLTNVPNGGTSVTVVDSSNNIEVNPGFGATTVINPAGPGFGGNGGITGNNAKGGASNPSGYGFFVGGNPGATASATASGGGGAGPGGNGGNGGAAATNGMSAGVNTGAGGGGGGQNLSSGSAGGNGGSGAMWIVWVV
jgi:hypothetical protein